MQENRFKLFGTWKNKLTVAQSVKLADEIGNYVLPLELSFELSFCPPMVALQSVAERIRPSIALTAQNAVWDDTVSFTGETDAGALKEIGCKFLIIGHSERRIYLGESDLTVAKKIVTAVR